MMSVPTILYLRGDILSDSTKLCAALPPLPVTRIVLVTLERVLFAAVLED